MLEISLLSIYVFTLFAVLVFCLTEVHLAWNYIRHKRKLNASNQLHHQFPSDLAEEDYPFVTIQLPIFNEQYVVNRLIDTVAAFNYPKSRFEIQVLDDSTDETIKLSRQKVAEYTAKGFQISLHHRIDRTGYKAGALALATKVAKGEFIAIFDADFVPDPDFLLKTVPHFQNEKIGVVQTRWAHLNRDYSLLTQIQAFFLDLHFTIEQGGRNGNGYFINFNGTAGIWRKATIGDAGGWQADTLTEDLDLSYRAQMRGWEFMYLENIGSPAELPVDMRAFKSQQFRWIKGGAETAKKILPQVMDTSLPFSVKYNAFAHLLSSSMYIIIFLMAVLSVPLLLVKNQSISFDYTPYGSFFLVSSVAIAYVYYISNKNSVLKQDHALLRFMYTLPAFLILTLGLSLHNAQAAIRGWWGEQTPFVRT
ncbi:MAG: cellulose synthase family protein, partial [Chitinophagales bacterium]